ncbi:UNVERIFIED_CONTAM: hypothetical protein PYX00_008040 [Menopon gallinae]|uniref:Cytochrome P450 302A1 n=1 Tax=Menopon gallinae TaxID=328185 RepID=A0AAW2HLT0_9NEOP
MSVRIPRHFRDIPGPVSRPFVGTLLEYLPVIGKYRFDTLHHNGRKKFEEYGPVVREEIVPGTNVVWIYDPEDIRELLKKEGRYPQRRSHLALQHYRRQKPEVYNNGGLLPTNGPEWYRLRSAFQKGLSSPRTVRRYLPIVNEVIDEFTEFIRRTGPVGDFTSFLSRIFLEMLGLVAFDHRLNSFSELEMRPGSNSGRLMESAMTINSCILKTDNGIQMWRHFDTPIYRKLSAAHEYLERVALDLIREKQTKPQSQNEEQSILETYLSAPEVDLKDVIGMTADMLLAGIDTTTYSTGFALYHLARNPEKQEILHEESRRLLPKWRTAVTPDVLDDSPYLKATVKESFRLNPISVGIGRILAEDAVFSNYSVPKGSVVVTQNQVISRFPQYFPEPGRFLPERWLKSNRAEISSPYLVLPFGHGPRTCIARRLAEQNMQTLILKLCRRFQIRWEGGDLDSRSELINKPDSALLFSFVPRQE